MRAVICGANGAKAAAKFIRGKKADLYNMTHLMEEN